MAGTTTMDVRGIASSAGSGLQASVIDIRGDITAATETTLMDAYAEATATNARVILLNFSELEYMNSSGIGLLVTLLIRANRQGHKIAAYGLTSHYRDIFELTRLDEAIHIYDTEADALASY
jgi:anti-sigma B factor antagonist